MKPGRHLALKRIPLNPPFHDRAIAPGTRFDVVECSPRLVLLRHEGIRVWKRRDQVEGLTRWVGPTPVQRCRIIDGEYSVVATQEAGGFFALAKSLTQRPIAEVCHA